MALDGTLLSVATGVVEMERTAVEDGEINCPGVTRSASSGARIWLASEPLIFSIVEVSFHRSDGLARYRAG